VSRLDRIELHMHLEGAAPPDFIRGLASEKGIDLSGIFRPNGSYAFRDFTNFLQVYEAATSVLATPEDYARLTASVLERQAAHGILYTEAFLSPEFCGGAALGPWREYLAAIAEAAAAAERSSGTILRAIVTPIRHFGPDRAKASALCAAETAGAFVVGLGLAGDESRGRPGDFAWSFDMAREAGLRLTAHAGEWSGPDSIMDALDDLRVDRIGHGVRAIEDPALIERLAASGTVLEVCPGSNVALGLYPSVAAHPIARLKKAGVRVTVSTDDPPFFHTNMDREYAALAEAFGWDDADFAALNRVAAEAAFCDAATRDRLIAAIDAENASAAS